MKWFTTSTLKKTTCKIILIRIKFIYFFSLHWFLVVLTHGKHMVSTRMQISKISFPGSSKIPFHGRYNNHCDSVIVLLPKFITV